MKERKQKIKNFDCEKVIDKQIAPLLDEMTRICDEHKLPMFSVVYYKKDNHGESFLHGCSRPKRRRHKVIEQAVSLLKGTRCKEILRSTKMYGQRLSKTFVNTSISVKEMKVLIAFAYGDQPMKVIADKLNLSRITVSHHMDEVRKKLGVSTNNGAAMKAHLLGLISPPVEQADNDQKEK